MAQFLDKLSQTIRGRKSNLLVFGYIRNEQKSIKLSNDVPVDIIIECLKYYFITYVWDPNGYSTDRLQLNPDTNTITKIDKGTRDGTAYLLGILENNGIHEIQFKILQIYYSAWRQTYGIYKVDDKIPLPLKDDFATLEKDSIAINNRGEKVICGSFHCESYNDCPPIKTGDIIDMIVDFEQAELRFRINGKDYEKVDDINPDYQYKAAVTLMVVDDVIQIIS